MTSNDKFDFFSSLSNVESCRMEELQFCSAGIFSLADILDSPLSELFQTAITEHYRTCRLNSAACTQLVKLLNDKGMNISLDTSIEPDIACVPKIFSSVATENQEIATAFDCLVADLWRIPYIEEIAADTYIPIDSLRNNDDVKKMLLERQQVLNYIEWFCLSHTCDLSENVLTSATSMDKIDWGKYPYNLLLDVVPVVTQIKSALEEQSSILARLVQRLDSLVYFDLSPEERNVIASLYIEGAINFSEPALQWGMELWSRQKKHMTLFNIRKRFQGGMFLAERGLLGSGAILELPIEELGLSVRSYNCLKRGHINTVMKLIVSIKDEAIIRKLPIGKKGLEEITSKLHTLGLYFSNEEPK
jgi:hypothetical protein